MTNSVNLVVVYMLVNVIGGLQDTINVSLLTRMVTHNSSEFSDLQLHL